MPTDSILNGPIVARDNEAARHGIPLSAANARAIIQEMESQVKSARKRGKMARFFADNARNATPEAIAVYRAYAESMTC